MYVDADFAGMWHKEFSELRSHVLSRTGYVITFCGCPVTWSRKLQTEIALSTTESEYIALSTATRELLPLRCILEDIARSSFIILPMSQVSDNIHTVSLKPSCVYENNTAWIVLSTTDSNFKPRTKHISIKWHHFHDHIQNGNLQILKVPTDRNWADIFTKPLSRCKFQTLRTMMMGW
jgi:hypothetical protein